MSSNSPANTPPEQEEKFAELENIYSKLMNTDNLGEEKVDENAEKMGEFGDEIVKQYPHPLYAQYRLWHILAGSTMTEEPLHFDFPEPYSIETFFSIKLCSTFKRESFTFKSNYKLNPINSNV